MRTARPFGYGYDSENRMVSGPSGVTLSYDPLGRLCQLTSGATTTRFLHDGMTLIAEYNGSNVLQRRFVHGPGQPAPAEAGEPLIWYEGASIRRYFHADERGSIVAVTDSGGALVGTRNRYDEYGNPQGTLTGRFGYTGQAWLAEAGIYYYRARMYNPTLGRFMQADPIGYGSGMNLYAYVLNDPVNLADPLGLTDIKVVGTPPSKQDWMNAALNYNDINRLINQISGTSNTDPEIVVKGSRERDEERNSPRAHLLVTLASVPYLDTSFCPGATVGLPNRWNPEGRIVSGKVGDRHTARSDVNALAAANGISTLMEVRADPRRVDAAIASPIPIFFEGGWSVHTNPFSGYTTVSNRGLSLRVNRVTGRVAVDIPAGFVLPNGSRLTWNETCHYNF